MCVTASEGMTAGWFLGYRLRAGLEGSLVYRPTDRGKSGSLPVRLGDTTDSRLPTDSVYNKKSGQPRDQISSAGFKKKNPVRGL